MKVIQTLNDLEWLKATQAEPQELIRAMEEDFLLLYEAESECHDVLTFRLPNQEALILLEAGDDVLGLLSDPFTLEYVEKHNQNQLEYYRIAKRIDHEFQLMYTLVNIHGQEIENFLAKHAEWNEGLGDFHV